MRFSSNMGRASWEEHVDGLIGWLMGKTASLSPFVGPMATFVFRPGGVAGGNVFTTWASLMAAVSLTPGLRIIYIDDSLAAAHMAAGGPYDLDNVTLAGNQASATFTLIIDDGATFHSSSLTISNGLLLQSNSTTSPWTPSSFFDFTIGSTCIAQSNAGAAPLLAVTAPASGGVIDVEMTGILGDFTHNVVTVAAGQQLTVRAEGPVTSIRAHAFGGLGTVDVFRESACTVSSVQDVSTFVIHEASLASATAYTPATAGNWQPAPALVSAALDQLAAPNFVFAHGNTGTGTGTVTVTTGNITKAKNGQMKVKAGVMCSTSGATTLTLQLVRDAATNIGTPQERRRGGRHHGCRLRDLLHGHRTGCGGAHLQAQRDGLRRGDDHGRRQQRSDRSDGGLVNPYAFKVVE